MTWPSPGTIPRMSPRSRRRTSRKRPPFFSQNHGPKDQPTSWGIIFSLQRIDFQTRMVGKTWKTLVVMWSRWIRSSSRSRDSMQPPPRPNPRCIVMCKRSRRPCRDWWRKSKPWRPCVFGSLLGYCIILTPGYTKGWTIRCKYLDHKWTYLLEERVQPPRPRGAINGP